MAIEHEDKTMKLKKAALALLSDMTELEGKAIRIGWIRSKNGVAKAAIATCLTKS